MDAVAWAVTGGYVLAASLLALQGCVYAAVALRRLGLRPPAPAPMTDARPRVTWQVPVRDEIHVLERALAAAAAQTWPRDRLEVQVLDDSSEAARALGAAAVARWRDLGLDVRHLPRAAPDGWKAGALQHGLASATGDLVALFDADFVPPPDFLERVVPHLADPGVASVQARWSHLDEDASAVSRAIAVGIDAHFAVEQAVRGSSGGVLSFSGTAAVWRRTAVEACGGWSSDTLAEDLDLSCEALRRGLRTVYLDGLACPQELPVEVASFRAQQARWAEGSAGCARKHLVGVLRAPVPGLVRAEALFHIFHYSMHPLGFAMFSLALLAPWLAPLPGAFTAGFVVATTAGPLVFFAVAEGTRGRPRAKRLAGLALLILMGAGLAWSNGVAFVRGLAGKRGPFVRTPKYGVVGRDMRWRASPYLPRGVAVVEGLLGFAGLAATFLLARSARFDLVGGTALFTAGFLTVFALSLVTLRSPRDPRAPRG